MQFIQKIRLPLVGILVLLSLGIMVLAYSWYFKDRFSVALQDLLVEASGMPVEVRDVDLNLFSGTGSIGFIGFNEKGAETKNMLEIEGVQITFSVMSVYWGPLVIQEITSPAGAINSYIIGSGKRIKNYADRWHRPAGEKPVGQERAFVVQSVNLGQGQMKFGQILIGSEVKNIIEFPETHLSFSKEQNENFSDLGQIRRILAEVADQSLQATGYRVLK